MVCHDIYYKLLFDIVFSLFFENQFEMQNS